MARPPVHYTLSLHDALPISNALNMRSRKAMLRLGLKEEGTFRRHMVNPDGTIRDTVYFSVIAEEWPDMKARLQAMLGGSGDRKSTRLNSSHLVISYAVFCLK